MEHTLFQGGILYKWLLWRSFHCQILQIRWGEPMSHPPKEDEINQRYDYDTSYIASVLN